MDLLERLGRAARLAGIVGVACAGVVLSYCSSSTVRPPDGPGRDHDRGRPDLALDAGGPDGALRDAARDQAVKADLRATDLSSPDKRPAPDTRLWDVLCE
jgi:hypothetical protein